MAVKILCGDARERLRDLPDTVHCVITDPVWPNVPAEMFPECDDPHSLLSEVMSMLPRSVRRVVIVMRSDSDPRFLTAMPERWPFFHAAWMQYVMPGFYGRKLGGNEIAYCFGEPIKSAGGRHLVPGMCQWKAQPRARNGHPCPRSITHMEWLVNWWSDPGETILDPFAGSGTIGIAAQRLRRDAILIEISPEYAAMAEKRIRDDAPLFAEVTCECGTCNSEKGDTVERTDRSERGPKLPAAPKTILCDMCGKTINSDDSLSEGPFDVCRDCQLEAIMACQDQGILDGMDSDHL